MVAAVFPLGIWRQRQVLHLRECSFLQASCQTHLSVENQVEHCH